MNFNEVLLLQKYITQNKITPFNLPLKTLLGILSACAVVFIWSGWVVSSRWGISTHFSPIDLTGLRFFSATLFLLPLTLRYAWHNTPWKKALIVALGCGFPYVWLVYLALKLIPAANASVLINGFLPITTSLLSLALWRTKIPKPVLGLFLSILIACMLMAYQPASFSWSYIGGILLLITATSILSSYMLAVKAWKIELRDIMAWVPLLNFVTVLPFWMLYSEGIQNIVALPLPNLLFHIAYQGIIVSVLALFLFSFAIKTIGAFRTSLFMALVPVSTAIMAMIFNHEFPTPTQWLGIALCTSSLGIFSIYSRKK